MRSFAYILLVVFLAGCGIDVSDDNAAEADYTHQLDFANLNNSRIVNGQSLEVTIEDDQGDVVKTGNLATISVTLARKCGEDESYTRVATVDAVKGIATFSIEGWEDGGCAVRATANGIKEIVNEDVSVGAKELMIEIVEDGWNNDLRVKRVFSLKIKATTSDKKNYGDTKLHLHGHHLRQFGKPIAEATVDANGVATFNNLYFIGEIVTDIRLVVASKDGAEAGVIPVANEVLLQEFTAGIGSATFDTKKKELALAGITAHAGTKLHYAIRNSDRADEHKVFCAGEVALAAGGNAVTVTNKECPKRDDLHRMFVDVLITTAGQTAEVRSTPLGVKVDS